MESGSVPVIHHFHMISYHAWCKETNEPHWNSSPYSIWETFFDFLLNKIFNIPLVKRKQPNFAIPYLMQKLTNLAKNRDIQKVTIKHI